MTLRIQGNTLHPMGNRLRKIVSVTLPAELLKQVDLLAKQERRTRTEIVESAIREWLGKGETN